MSNKVWRYRLTRAEAVVSHCLGEHIDFANEWISVHRGWIRVSERYAWDGCSPSVRVPGTRIWLGTPDGPLGSDGRPASWRASLIHDALCQFRMEIPGLTKATATAVFVERLLADGAPWWMPGMYGVGVDLLGPQDFLGDLAATA